MKPRLALPFAHLNLTRNPFGELTPDERASLAVTDVADYVSRLQQPRFVLQITGEQGRGKTTHLLALRRHFPEAPYIYLPEDEAPPPVPKAPILFLDETQRFSAGTRCKLWQRRASFVVATHEDHTAEFEAAGLRHHTLHLKGLSAERLAGILSMRLEAARRATGEIPFFEATAVDWLIERFGDDLRAIETHLYEVFQGLGAPGAVKLPPDA